MTEAQWLGCTSVTQPIFRWLRRHGSERKFYLAAVAAVRHLNDHLRDPRSRQALAVAERFADGLAPAEEMQAAHDEAMAAAFAGIAGEAAPSREQWRSIDAATAASFAATPPQRFPQPIQGPAGAWIITYNALLHTARAGGRALLWPRQLAILRDIFGNPFRPAPTLDPAWLRWRDGTIPRLAQQMYDSRDFASMPILADALEEAGCTSGDILEHCRGLGPHVRGCWVVDLILGKSDPP